MKTTVTFETDSPDEQCLLQQLLSVDNYRALVSDFTEYLRQNYKYKETPDDFDTIRETWLDMSAELRGIDF